MINKNNSIELAAEISVDDITELFDGAFSHFNSLMKVNSDNIPSESMKFYQWSNEEEFRLLMKSYQDSYYNNNELKPNQKGLYSLWAQWYFGLIVPPMMLMLIEYPQAVDTDYNLFQVEFHETGRPNIAYYQLTWMDESISLLERYHSMLERHIIPVCEKIESYRGINGRLLWNNIGYVMYWYLENFKDRIGAGQYEALIQSLYFEQTLPNGKDNPLYRTVILKNNIIQRRCCCQRNKLPGVGNCHDCPLESTA
ncbi:siderophore-iron reductase FhuF [Xenorhabdus nematophila]|uniref:siderophore-iron reductase FhuF n=1 Tax=Xenorhabdus nematophila TaxID=628 RepID=UPI000542A57B|nr:siderophore-iron reductase FhuF [Xenorhabdus nematophila]CEE94494.1 ferric hydroxamate transport protein [Xenorhabdus nematophila str. Anatoliense]CEF31807.1 ferric hydroxamate transport protein [Xenorhabdus nematophila str. Websteri]AYA39594.1 hydroxamate siderophore iron reductase FhuF [Xenorhabdus nematophila]KHD29338.1 iron reductase [Xenorhabdus nematophila]MBA0018159.1 siderophore-iron reductase FhuF [Xenorhabdus nematophila]